MKHFTDSRHPPRIEFLLCVSVWLLFFPVYAQAASLTFVSDTIGTSVPGAPANHTIRFTTTTAIPTNGKITITPQSGAFKIPALLGFLDIDLSVNGVEKTLGLSPLVSIVGVGVVTGTSSSISFTFPSSIAALSAFVVKVGKHASVGGTGVERIGNPLFQGSYRIAIDSYNAGGANLDRASAMIATVFPVRITLSLPIVAEKNAAFEPTSATTTILTNTNGTFFKVTTPANFVSFSDEVQMSISAFHQDDVAPIAPPPSGKAGVGSAYELSVTRLLDESAVSSFSSNVTFDMFYSDSDISGVDESTLTIRKWNGSAWVAISGSTLFASENRVSAEVSSFSMYSIIGDESTSSLVGGGSSGGGSGSSNTMQCPAKGDVNNDCKVNLVDFSIAAYWYKRPSPPANVDINSDGVVTLVDFSIMAFYWSK